MNLIQLAQRVKLESGRSGAAITTLTGLPNADLRIVNWVADAWLEIQRMPRNWRFMQRELDGPTVAGVRGYTGAELDGDAQVGKWYPLSKEGYFVTAEKEAGKAWRLRPVEKWDRFRDAFEVTESQPGPPQFVAISPENKLFVGPTPDGIYTIRAKFFRALTQLTAEDAEPDMPDDFHMVIVWRALMEVAAYDAANEVYQRASVNFDNLLDDLITDQAEQITFKPVSL